MPIIKIPSPLQSYIGDQKSLTISGSNVEEVIINLVKRYPVIKPHIFDPEGRLRSFITIFLGEVNIKDTRNGMKTLVKDDDQLVIVTSMAGG